VRNEVDVVLQTNMRGSRESLTTRLDDNGHVHLKSEKKATRPVLSWPSGELAAHRRGSSEVDNKFFRTRIVNKLSEESLEPWGDEEGM